MHDTRYNPTLHTLALLTAGATFPLIFMGGLVTSHGAGMSVPDWPNSYGYNMFLFPPSQWVGGIFYEHTHRLMGTVVGFMSILLTIATWKWETRRSVRWLCTGVLGMVIFQGVLGGLRVVLVKLDLAVVHACLAQAFFCLAALASLMTSKWWMRTDVGATLVSPSVGTDDTSDAPTLATICVVIIFLQLIVGALMRHYEAGLAIPDLPLAYGKVLPPMNSVELQRANGMRVHDPKLQPVTLKQIWLHFGHRIGAIVASLMVLAASGMTLMKSTEPVLRRPAWLMLLLLAGQLTLGVLTVLLRKPADIASIHVAVGALLLVTSFVLAIRSIRSFCGTSFQPVILKDQHGLETRATKKLPVATPPNAVIA